MVYVVGNQLNPNLAGTGFNLKKMLNRIKEQILFAIFEPEKLLELNLMINSNLQISKVLKV